MYRAFDKFYLRTPAYSINKLSYLPDDLSAFIKNALDDDYFMSAIKVASPSFYTEALKLKSNQVLNRSSKKIGITLFKYWLRICHRSTPFGLFSGGGPGMITNNSDITLREREMHYASIRLDMDIVFAIAEKLSRDELIRSQIKFKPNNTIYRIGDYYRYVEYFIVDQKRRYHISQFYYSEYVENLLQKAVDGLTMNDLIQLLSVFDFSHGESYDFVKQLIDSQILVPELHPPVTGTDPLSFIIEKLEQLSNIENIRSPLVELQRLLQHQQFSAEHMENVNSAIGSILTEDEVATQTPIQVDMYVSSVTCSLNKSIIDDLVNSTVCLFPLKDYKRSERLELFKNRFSEKYEGQEIPLNILMDADVGIGYGTSNHDSYNKSALLETFHLDQDYLQSNAVPNALSLLQVRKLMDFYDKQQTEIIITDEDIDKFKSNEALPTADSMFIRGSLLRANTEALNKENYTFLFSNCSGPSGVNFLGRFCYGNSDLHAFSKEIIHAEEECNENAVFAEISHIPQARVANVSQRPVFRHYEIPYVTPSLLPDSRIINVNDILVSVKDNEIILRSGKLNKRVIPRLTTAQNYNKSSLAVFKFLCDLQYHNIRPGFVWDWGALDDELFLPRVRYKRLILSRARWFFRTEEFDFLLAKDINLPDAFNQLRNKYKMPRYLLLCENDNELFIDIENTNCLEIICEHLKQSGFVVLTENLQLEQAAIVSDVNNNKFNNELIIPITRLQAPKTPKPVTSYTPISLKRNFIPGSEWLYVKIYASPNTVEMILRELFPGLVHNLMQKNKIDKFFFVRYTDPEFHLRARFHGQGRFWSEILHQLYKKLDALVSNGLIFRISTDTYIREIERYGEQTMDLSEDLFSIDSLFILEMIAELPDIEKESNRWLIAAKAVDRMFSDFQFDINRKYTFCEDIVNTFTATTEKELSFKRQIDVRYRRDQKLIHQYLNPVNDNDEQGKKIERLLNKRSVAIQKKVHELYTISGHSIDIVYQLLPNYIHMFLNKMLIFNQKKQEIVIYALLAKYYRSKMAMEKYNKA